MLEQLSLGLNALILAAAAAVVWAAGSRLARQVDQLARQTGLGHAVLGLLLLGGMTSLPELAVAVTATVAGAPLLTINDVLGSASINVLILALADAAYGRHALTVTPGTPQTLLQGVMSVLLLMLVAAAVVAQNPVVFGLGVWSWLLLAAYAVTLRMLTAAHGLRSWMPDSQGPRRDEPRPADEPGGSRARLLAGIAATGAAILAGGFFLAQSGHAIAEQSGLGDSFVGAVLLGFATSLPEVSTVLAAVRRGRYEMAIGDVFGTNLFNVTIIVLVDALHEGGAVLAEAGRFAAFAALLAAVMTLLFVIGMIERRDRTLWRMGADSLAVVAAYLGGLVVLYHLK